MVNAATIDLLADAFEEPEADPASTASSWREPGIGR
jgi:hypothetical protein